jgi:hypothetical protein
MSSRPDLDPFVLHDVRRWPRSGRLDGLARGWFGTAWTWLTLVRRGLVVDRPRTRTVIARRLQARVDYHGHVGLMVGSAAAPTVAAQLAAVDGSAAAVLAGSLAQWQGSFGARHPLELMLGVAGSVLAGAEIETLRPRSVPRPFMQRCHDVMKAELARRVDRGPSYLGMAHGLAGILLAAEAGASAFGLELATELRAAVIDAIMSHRTRGPGRIANWQCQAGDARPRFINGWCHGAAGVALAAMAARRLSSDPSYDPLVECALPSAYALRGGGRDFCCGAAGQAHVFVEAYRLLGDRRWLRRARVAERGLTGWCPRNRTLQRGRLGLEYLRLRLDHPDHLPMPGLGPLSA